MQSGISLWVTFFCAADITLTHRDILILPARLIPITANMRRQDRSLQEEPTAMAEATARQAGAARDATFVRDFFAPTVVANAWAATLYPVVEGEI